VAGHCNAHCSQQLHHGTSARISDLNYSMCVEELQARWIAASCDGPRHREPTEFPTASPKSFRLAHATPHLVQFCWSWYPCRLRTGRRDLMKLPSLLPKCVFSLYPAPPDDASRRAFAVSFPQLGVDQIVERSACGMYAPMGELMLSVRNHPSQTHHWLCSVDGHGCAQEHVVACRDEFAAGAVLWTHRESSLV